MTSTAQAEVCRITVFGPTGRSDLAVPLSVSVASLLPVLLRRHGEPAGRSREPGSWILQRLGDGPFDPAGTPESLDWRDGEELYLRPATDPLPELDFDDVADGIATAVSRHPDRWQPEFNRWLFLGLAIGGLLAAAWSLLDVGSPVLGVVGAMVIAAALLTGAIGAGRRTTDRALILLLGIGGCLFTGIAGAVGPAGVVAARELQGTPILVAGLAVTLSAGLLLCARVAGASGIPFTPFGVLVSIGSLAAVSQWLHLGLLLTPQQVAATLPAALLVVLIFAPRIAIRMARIQGPQLPRTAKELQLDIEPMPAQEAGHRVRYADGYLTSTAVGAAVVVGASLPFLADGTFFPMLLGALIAAAVLLRARALMGAWQRVPLLAAGTLGCALLISALLTELPVQWQGVLLAALAVVFVLLLLGMTRQPLRRLRPIWGHLANGLETITAIAIVPVLLQLFGVYVWARGLAG